VGNPESVKLIKASGDVVQRPKSHRLVQFSHATGLHPQITGTELQNEILHNASPGGAWDSNCSVGYRYHDSIESLVAALIQ
jgi:hypothetical protein